MAKAKEVMTSEHPRWDAFCKKLETAIEKNGCTAKTGKQNAKRVMKEMGGINIKASCDYFEDNGGYCDCEILWNVAWR